MSPSDRKCELPCHLIHAKQSAAPAASCIGVSLAMARFVTGPGWIDPGLPILVCRRQVLQRNCMLCPRSRCPSEVNAISVRSDAFVGCLAQYIDGIRSEGIFLLRL